MTTERIEMGLPAGYVLPTDRGIVREQEVMSKSLSDTFNPDTLQDSLLKAIVTLAQKAQTSEGRHAETQNT